MNKKRRKTDIPEDGITIVIEYVITRLMELDKMIRTGKISREEATVRLHNYSEINRSIGLFMVRQATLGPIIPTKKLIILKSE